jgi:hypothetical protein
MSTCSSGCGPRCGCARRTSRCSTRCSWPCGPAPRTQIPSARLALHDHLRRVQDVFAQEITAHAAKRFVGQSDADFLAAVAGNAIAGALIGSFETWARRGTVDDLGELTRRALDVLRHGIDERDVPVETGGARP